MAVGRLSVHVGKVGKAEPHAAYISRVGKYADRLNRGERLEATGSGNMPAWAQHNPLHFWQAADQNERSNGSTYREFELSLPRELTPAQRRELVADWIKQEIGEKHVYQYAIHNPEASDGKEQPHAHLMFSERRLDGIERDPEQFFKRYNSKHPERGGARKENTGKDQKTRKEELKAQRDRWEKMVNSHLQRAGSSARIDMRSYQDQGVDIQPEKKMLPSEWRNPAKRAEVIELRQIKADLLKARQELNRMVPDLKAALKAAGEKANARATPEKIKRVWETYLEQAGKDIEFLRQERTAAYVAAQEARTEHFKTSPERPTGMLAGITGQRRQYEQAWHYWNQENTRLLAEEDKANAVMRSPLPHQVKTAEQRFEQEQPELFKEWQRLKAVKEQQAKDERDRQRQPPRGQGINIAALERQMKADGFSPEQQRIVLERIKENMAKSDQQKQTNRAGKREKSDDWER